MKQLLWLKEDSEIEKCYDSYQNDKYMLKLEAWISELCLLVVLTCHFLTIVAASY